MKKILILLFLTMISLFSYSQWNKLNSGTNWDLFSVHFLNKDTGFAVGGSYDYHACCLLKTIDGGITWDNQGSVYNKYLYSIDFADSLTGFVGGSAGFFLKTTDGGGTWDSIASGHNQVIVSINFPTPDIGFILFTDGILKKSTNGGLTWYTLHTFTSTASFYKIYFVNTNIGFVIGGGGTVYKTTDSGLTWHDMSSPGVYAPAICFIDNNIGFIGGDERVFKTTDCFTTTQSTITAYGCQGYDIYFTNYTHGFMVGSISGHGGIVSTTDGGNSWTQQNLPTNTSFLRSVYFANQNIGYAVGYGGEIIKTTNGGVVNIFEQYEEEIFNIYPNPVTDKIRIINSQKTEIEIMNIEGQIVNKINCSDLNTTIDLRDLSSGVYFIKAVSEKAITVKKFIKE